MLLIAVNLCTAQKENTNIILINVGVLNRSEIAQLLKKIDTLQPKVIGIDIIFEDSKRDEDSDLVFTLMEVNNLVMCRTIKGFKNGLNIGYDDYSSESIPEFLVNASTGFNNAIIEDRDMPVLKEFSLFEKVRNSVEYHFAVQTSMLFDSLKTINFINRNEKIVQVKYSSMTKFRIYQGYKLVANKEYLSEEEVRDKIVLFGFVGPGSEDRFYTPDGNRIYGVEYLASIIHQILED